jgi:hypothetical protein
MCGDSEVSALQNVQARQRQSRSRIAEVPGLPRVRVHDHEPAAWMREGSEDVRHLRMPDVLGRQAVHDVQPEQQPLSVP